MSLSASGNTKGARPDSGWRLLTPLLPLLVWVLAIQMFSTDAFSSGETSKFIVPFLRFVYPSITPPQIDFWHTVIRKCSHITEYFVLGLLSYWSVRMHASSALQATLRAAAFVLLIALTDEFHQMFTASRGPSLVDVGYDFFGGVIALGLMTGRGWKGGDRRWL